ncbi:oocyte zinc finger protein XlCOF8.4-like [Melanotaenia boesemani]|uniref:oocyte zinc finger protein XlCOF8.4-like n=1 Tax=Melanotaenia boesemani TaxID=1250792 RepID=UPI001C03D5C6|nr:oocyte zinc finger protein XlCOF8.4-like [Melanotaenia boesemani]
MCSVVGCDSWRRNARRFTLPEDPEKRLEWVQFVLEVNSQRLKESSCTDISVCSEHFTRDCFLNPAPTSDTIQLKSGAVPTVCVKEEPEEVELKQEPVEIEASSFYCEQPKISDSPTPIIEKVSSLMGAPATSGSNDSSDSSTSDIMLMLQKIKNLDIIREKAALLQKERRFVVNEKQLLQLFRSKCPLCQSKVKVQKIVCRVHLELNLNCLQCDYRKQWKNLSDAGISAAEGMDVAECTEVSLETGDGQNTRDPEIAGMMQQSDISSDPEELNSDEDWEPEEHLFYEQLHSESDEESSYEDDNVISKDSRLCTDCGKFYDGQKQHICEHKIKPYSCNICGKRCVSELSLSNHNRVHDENYEHPCKYCHVTFKTKTDKITHEQTHVTQEKPYQCSDCSETFAKNRDRRIHMRDHRGPKQYKCKFCGLEFPRSISLQRHLFVHTGEKPFKCSVCQRGFNQASHLKSHLRLHTGEKPYKCRHCDKCFNHNVSLKSHIQCYHKAKSRCGPKKKMNKGEDGNERSADSELDDVEEERDTDEEVHMKRMGSPKNKRRRTGRPIGRPKRSRAEKIEDQDSNTKTAKVQKTKKMLSSSEESEQSCGLTEDEEDRSVQR